MREITFVTAFHDIGRETDDSGISFESYFPRIEALLNIPVRFVFFTSPKIYARLSHVNPQISFVLEDEPPWQHRINEVCACWAGYMLPNCKDTPAFACLTMSKFCWLMKAIEMNPFATDHFGWIDAGVLKIARRPELLATIKPQSRGVRCMTINYTSKTEAEDPRFVQQPRFKVAGGLFVGDSAAIGELCRLVLNEAESHLQRGVFGLEQELMALVYKKHPELFAPYYGRFCDLIQNYSHLRESSDWVENIGRVAATQGDEEEASRVRDYLLRSAENAAS